MIDKRQSNRIIAFGKKIAGPCRYKLKGGLLLLGLLAFSCKKQAHDAGPAGLFTKLDAGQTGIGFRNDLPENDALNILEYLYYYNGAGVAAGDVNNDGLTDLYFVANRGENKLYLNRGGFGFEDVTTKAGVQGQADWQAGVTMADVNGDGWLDIYVCAVGHYKGLRGSNELYINNRDGTFTEKAAEYGLDFTGFSTQAAFFDYDHDGDLDCYLLTHAVHTSRSYDRVSTRALRDHEAGDHLYENRNGKFIDVSVKAGIYGAAMGYGLGLAVGDLDNDGWEDVYVSNDFHEDDYYYRNNHDGTFSEKIRQSFAYTSRFSMGNDLADVNNDGWLDVMTLDMFPADERVEKASMGEDPFDIYRYKLSFGYQPQYSRNCLQINLKRPLQPRDTTGLRFAEIAAYAGVAATDWSWSPLLADYNNDGRIDLFISNGIYKRPNNLDYVKYISSDSIRYHLEITRNPEVEKRAIANMPDGQVPNYLFLGSDSLMFADVSAKNGFSAPGCSNGATYADLDNDGDLDLITNDLNAPAGVFRNEGTSGHSLTIRLKGDGKNTFGVGAKLLLKTALGWQTRQLMPTRGFLSATEPRLHFGLGRASGADSLVVLWPLGRAQVLTAVKAGQSLLLEEKNAALAAAQFLPQPARPPLLEARPLPGLAFTHHEDDYEDFNREGLMPFKASTEGPALAVGDANGDGLDDVFVGGAQQQPAGLFFQQKNGSFLRVQQPLFQADSVFEDVDALWFDADGDRDLDLYVVSGGNGFTEGQAPLLDRLYRNDGTGRLHRDTTALPRFYENKSCVRPADVDGDGDMDLFVGGRVVAFHYGEAPRSQLLINDGTGHFTDRTDYLAPALRRAGMVSSADWADFDGDGKPDLLVAGEWMEPLLFFNRNGKLVPDKHLTPGQEPLSGLWQGVTATDLDADGDADVLLGNLGLNTKLRRGSPPYELKMWVKDLDDNGKSEQVVGYRSGDVYFPVASKDELSRQLPALINKRFTTYEAFAGKSIDEIFEAGELRQARQLTLNQWASLWLENDGKGRFRVHQLPMQAQWSRVFSLLPADLNADHRPDLLVGGNFFGASTYQGRYESNSGLVVMGGENARMAPRWSSQTGFSLSGEVRSIRPLKTADGRQWWLVARSNATLLSFRQHNSHGP